MIDLTQMDTSNKNQLMNGLEKSQNIDIVDYQTVSFDSNARKAKRSLSLNVYKYEQILGPKEGQSSSVESLIPQMAYLKNTNSSKDVSTTTTKVFNSFGFIASIGSLIMIACVIFLLVGNRWAGKLAIDIEKIEISRSSNIIN